jgi:hypothetical protein
MFSAEFGNRHATSSSLDDGQYLTISHNVIFHVDLLCKAYEKILLLTVSVIYRENYLSTRPQTNSGIYEN